MKSMLRALALAGAILAAATSALAQGQPASGSVQANATSGAAPMRAVTPTAWIDRWCAGTQNSMPLRGASTWGCIDGTNLNAIAGLTSANNKCFYFTGSGTSAVYDCSSFGRSVANVADAAALRTLAGSVIGTNVQAWDPDLDALAALSGTNTIYYRSASNTWTAVTIGGLLSFSAGTLNIGDVELTSIAGLTSAADKFPYYTGSGTAALADLSSAFRTFLTTSSSANLRSVLTDETGTGAAMFGTAPTVDGLFNISGALKFGSPASPAQITSNQNDYNPSSVNCATASTLLINSDAARDITGLAGGVFRLLDDPGQQRIVHDHVERAERIVDRREPVQHGRRHLSHSVRLGYAALRRDGQSLADDLDHHGRRRQRHGDQRGDRRRQRHHGFRHLHDHDQRHLHGHAARSDDPEIPGGTSGTYTTPAGVTAIKITLIGGGAGSFGGGNSPGTPTVGNPTCWNTSGAACTTPVYQAGGGGLSASNANGGTGGTVSGSGTCDWSVDGSDGTSVFSGTNAPPGAASSLGAVARGGYSSSQAGQNGKANSGGSGGAGYNGGGGQTGSVGGAGATCVKIISSPAATYTYAVAATANGGTAGTGGGAGGNGAGGQIIVEEY
jgi:hypothetical protein